MTNPVSPNMPLSLVRHAAAALPAYVLNGRPSTSTGSFFISKSSYSNVAFFFVIVTFAGAGMVAVASAVITITSAVFAITSAVITITGAVIALTGAVIAVA